MKGNLATGVSVKLNSRKKEGRKEGEKDSVHQLYILEDHCRDLWKSSGWAFGLEKGIEKVPDNLSALT